jgi:branched-chain amino acid transport system substrate-binding protein
MTKKQPRQSSIGLTTNIFIVLVILSLIIAIIYFLKPAKEKTIKIGCLLTLSEAGASMAKDVLDGLVFACEELNSRGGINGKKIELIVEDTQSSPEKATAAFRKIEAEHQPVLFISNMSSVGVKVAPLAEEFNVPLVGLVTSTGRVTVQNSWAFRYWSSAETEASALLSIIRRLNVASIGILNVGDEYGMSVIEIVLKALEKTDIKILHREFVPNEKQYGPLIKEMTHMASILAFGYPPNINRIAKSIRKNGFRGNVIYSNAAARPDVRAAAEIQGAYVPAPLIYKKDFIFAKEAGDKFSNKYGRPFNHYSANGYDFLIMFSNIMSGKDISRASVKNALKRGFIYTGVYGEIRLKSGERDMSFDYYPARIVDGEIEFMK